MSCNTAEENGRNTMNVKSLTTLLLDNIGIRQTIFKNTLWLALGEGISRLLTFLLTIYVIRILGPEEFGRFAFALGFIAFFVILSDLGISDIIPREFSRSPEQEKDYSALFSLKLLLTFGALILIVTGSFFITSDPTVQKVIWILSIFALLSNFPAIFYAFFRARQKMQYESWMKMLQAVIVAGVGLFIVFTIPSVTNLSYGYAASAFAVLLLFFLFFHFRIKSITLRWNIGICKQYLKISLPVGLAAFIGGIYISMDSVMMGYWGQITETGWYNAAYRIIGIVITPAVLISVGFAPALSRAWGESKSKLQAIWSDFMSLMMILGFPIIVGGAVLAPKLITFFYGEEYTPAILALQILIFVGGFMFLYNPFALILVICDEEKKYFFIQATAAGINLVLNFILIPKYSLYGAAVATAITYGILFILGMILARRFTPISIFNAKLVKIFLIASIASLAMLVVINFSLIANLHVLFTVFIGAVTYFTFLFIFYKLN